MSENKLKNPLKNMNVQAAANSSACSSNEGCVSAEEFGVEVSRKVIRWAEDIADIPNNYCPHCGREFRYDDEVAEVSGDLVIVFHYKCFKEVFEEGDC